MLFRREDISPLGFFSCNSLFGIYALRVVHTLGQATHWVTWESCEACVSPQESRGGHVRGLNDSQFSRRDRHLNENGAVEKRAKQHKQTSGKSWIPALNNG